MPLIRHAFYSVYFCPVSVYAALGYHIRWLTYRCYRDDDISNSAQSSFSKLPEIRRLPVPLLLPKINPSNLIFRFVLHTLFRPRRAKPAWLNYYIFGDFELFPGTYLKNFSHHPQFRQAIGANIKSRVISWVLVIRWQLYPDAFICIPAWSSGI